MRFIQLHFLLPGVVLLAAALLALRPCGAQVPEQTVRLACTADTNVSSFPEEVDHNFGAMSRLRLKGIEMFMLAKFDARPVNGWAIRTASLWLHTVGESRLKTIGISTIAVDWVEGTGTNTPATGGATFTWADFGKRRWGGRQSDFTDAAMTQQGTLCSYTDLVPHENGWIEIAVPPRFVELLRDGRSFGLAISDEKGQTHWNNDVDSREQAGFEPYLVVTGQPGTAAPISAAGIRASTRASRRGPIGPTTAIRIGAGVHAGAAMRSSFARIWAYGECEKVDAVSGRLLEAAEHGAARSDPEGVRTAVWDATIHVVTLAGARNEFVAFQLCIEPAAASGGSFQLSASDLSGAGEIPARNVRLFRDWYVKDRAYYPEAAVPLAGPLVIPDPQNKIPGQRNASVFIEIYVPHTVAPGLYHGAVTVRSGGQSSIVPIRLTVRDLTLPDTLSFNVDLNAYNTPGDAALEQEYQRMAQEHRCTLNILGYFQDGRPNRGYVPPLEGTGANIHVADWTEFDRRFGPYFDGSAFKDLPRGAVPVHDAYLPFCEGWPSSIQKHYHYTPTVTSYPEMITEHALKAPPIQDAFDNTFKQEFQAIVEQFVQHFKAKGWTHTQFQFYMNNKYYFRDPKEGGYGSSWWLLDEPMHRDDFLALRFFGGLFQEAVAKVGAGNLQLVFRCDVSRPQWQRDWLAGVVNLMSVSSAFYTKNDRCMEQHRQQGVIFWNYGSANDIRDSNLFEERWAVRAYLAGADGILPWDSLGNDMAFDQPTATALLYPGIKRFGIDGPIASLRLKAFRRGQQDVEYLALLARRRGWTREELALNAVDALLPHSRERAHFVNADGSTPFDNLSEEQLEELREWASRE